MHSNPRASDTECISCTLCATEGFRGRMGLGMHINVKHADVATDTELASQGFARCPVCPKICDLTVGAGGYRSGYYHHLSEKAKDPDHQELQNSTYSTRPAAVQALGEHTRRLAPMAPDLQYLPSPPPTKAKARGASPRSPDPVHTPPPAQRSRAAEATLADVTNTSSADTGNGARERTPATPTANGDVGNGNGNGNAAAPSKIQAALSWPRPDRRRRLTPT